MTRLIMILLVTVFISSGCGDDTGSEDVACTASIEPGIVLEVRDSATNQSLADNATAIISSLTYTEQMSVCMFDAYGQGISLCGAYERAGTYDISLSVNGYQPWNKTGVVVAPSICHVATVHLVAEMIKIP